MTNYTGWYFQHKIFTTFCETFNLNLLKDMGIENMEDIPISTVLNMKLDLLLHDMFLRQEKEENLSSSSIVTKETPND